MKLLENKDLKIALLFLPLYLNYGFNFFNNNGFDKFINFNYYNLFVTVVFFLFLFLIGKSIKKSTKLNTVSISIITYIFSFFLLDNLLLFITTELKLYQIFMITNLIWFIYLLVISREYKFSLSSLFTYFVLNFFSNKFLNNLITDSNIIGDVYDFHYPHVKNIYEQGFYFSVNNAVLEGYPQFLNYIQALLNNIIINLDNYIYLGPSTNILYFLTALLFVEVGFNRNINLIMIGTFTIFIYNSEWLKFLFLDSLMVEGLVAYLFATILISIHNSIKSKTNLSYIIFTLFGLLYLTKQFISLITLVMLILFFYKKNYRVFIPFGFSGFIIQEISYRTFFSGLEKNYHLKEINLKDTLLDFIFFRDLNLTNIITIIKNLFVDKPLTYILLIFFLLLFFEFYRNSFSDFAFTSNVMSILLNFIFIFALYVSIWRNMELESPIRYMLSFFHITFITIFNMANKLFSKQ